MYMESLVYGMTDPTNCLYKSAVWIATPYNVVILLQLLDMDI